MLKPQSKTTAELEAEIEALKSALRWNLGFIVNVTVGLELVVGAKANTAQIRQGIKEAVKRLDVPRGVLKDLRDAERVLKEWDHRTFRVEQDAEVVERNGERVVFRHRGCPHVFRTMRQYAPFLLKQVDVEHYRNLSLEGSACDFLCIPHTLCRYVLVDWLSDGKYCVQELYCHLNQPGTTACGFAVKPKTRYHDHQ